MRTRTLLFAAILLATAALGGCSGHFYGGSDGYYGHGHGGAHISGGYSGHKGHYHHGGHAREGCRP